LSNTIKHWWDPIAHFVKHSFVGTAIFIVVAVPAVGLNFLVHFLEKMHVSIFVIRVLEILESVILVFDAIMFLIYLVIQGYKSIKEFLDD